MCGGYNRGRGEEKNASLYKMAVRLLPPPLLLVLEPKLRLSLVWRIEGIEGKRGEITGVPSIIRF